MTYHEHIIKALEADLRRRKIRAYKRVFATVMLGLVIWALVVLAGCDSLARLSTTEPAANVSKTTTQEKLNDHGKPVERQTTTISGSASGTGASASGSKAQSKMDSQPAIVALNGTDGITATGGGGKSSGSAIGSASTWANPAIYTGIVLALAGLALAYFGRPKGIVVAMVGVGLLCMVLFPPILWWTLSAGAVILCVYLIATDEQRMRMKEALRATVGGIAAAPPEAQEAVKQEVRKQASRQDKTTIDTIKKQDEILA